MLNSVYLWDPDKEQKKTLVSSSCDNMYVKIHVVLLFVLISLADIVFTETGVLPYQT